MGSGGVGGTGGIGGSGGAACTMPKVDCNGTCADLMADAANCGACGYACEAGRSCESGTCQPFAVVEGVTAPYAFALDAASVYFVTPVADVASGVPPAVRKVGRGGGAAVAVFDEGLFRLRSRSLAFEAGTLFFGDLNASGTVRKGATAGGDVTAHVADQPAVPQLVVADGRLWWSVLEPTARLRRAALNGGAGGAGVVEEQFPDPFFRNGRVAALALEGAPAVLYWTHQASPVAAENGLWRKAEGAVAERLTEAPGLRSLALGSDGVYVADATGIRKGNKAAPGPLTEVVAAVAAGGEVWGLAATATHLYWLAVTAVGQLEVHRSGLDGSEARVLGRVAAKKAEYWAAPIGPSQLVVDGGHVYFSDVGSVTGNTAVSNPGLEGVTGLADGAIYRLPE
jgi:Stigma-specific protein, Stig1